MAKILLAVSVDQPWTRDLLMAAQDVARSDRFGEHSLTSDPGEADIILFLDSHQAPRDWRQRGLLRHPWVQRFPDKSFVYDERDVPRDSLPGLYVAMPRSRFDDRRHRSFAYYFLPNDPRAESDRQPDLLFSFQGRNVGPVRERVLGLRHPRSLVEDTSRYDFFAAGLEDRARMDTIKQRYRETMGRSKFVVCPRGAGSSSLRLFEALACGRVPVVISDDWVPPHGVDWHGCMVRVPESEVESIPRRIERLEPEWEEMSRKARATYDNWFATDVWFHRAAQHCLELKSSGVAGPARQWTQAEFWRAGLRRYRSDAACIGHLRLPGGRASFRRS